MVERIWKNLELENERLRKVMESVPRHQFVDSALRDQAYRDQALPIGSDQTISQPTIVAMMTNALNPGVDDKILEIGTGSGYQTAILAGFARRLYSVERIPELARRAQNLLAGLGYGNIIFKTGDGSLGWESWAPYDRIIVTAGAPVVSDRLKAQLAEGGRLILPCGERNLQKLLQIDRRGDTFVETDLGDCRFVPLVGKEGWEN